MRMGYAGYVNESQYLKFKLPKPYKFLMLSTIHALHHRKGGFDVSANFIICILTCLILNRTFNISQVIFNHMVHNVHGERFLQYPRFIQMLLDDQIPNLPKLDNDEIELDHMDNDTSKRLNVYQGKEEPPYIKKFGAIAKQDDIAPAHDKWRHDDAAKNSEKAGGETVTENVEAAAGGETVGKTFVEGVVHTDSSETKSDIDITRIAPTTGFNGNKGRQTGPSRKRKNSDEEDASYVPSSAEVIKTKKGRGMKQNAKPTGVTPRKLKIQKTTAKAVKDTTGESVQVPESVTMEVPIVQAEIHVPTPPTSPIQESIPIQTEVNVTTPPQQSQNVEEPGSTSKKSTTPLQQGSGMSFPEVPHNLGTGPIPLEDVGDVPFFDDARVDGVIKRVAELEKAKAETDEKLKASDAKLKATEEKLKSVEAENVVLKNEILAMNEKILDVQAGNSALNEMIDELLTTNFDLNDSHATMSVENEIMQKELEDVRADKENKSRQLEMLYAVIEDRLGVNVHATYNEIRIRRAEAWRMERQQRDAQEAADATKDIGKSIADEEVLESPSQKEQSSSNVEVNTETAIVLAQQFILVGEAVDVPYGKAETKS
ncbi:hypothetical protein HanOQP8_Chr02g0049721 [Helianthus annuus]|nr:hypothetical protein HanOQP8_Chr02g0049721 [Helianthus annuus]